MVLTAFPLFTGQFIETTYETEGEGRRSQECSEQAAFVLIIYRTVKSGTSREIQWHALL